MAKSRRELLEQLANMISDYRKGEVAPRTPELIEDWLQQFPSEIQEHLLGALTNVFSKTYLSRNDFKSFLKMLAVTDKLSPGNPPKDYWQRANLLRIQRGGNSQNEILAMFDEVLQETHGYGLTNTGSDNGDFIYLDDCIGTGNRVRWDICAWLEGDTPNHVILHIITPILYQGSYWIDEKIEETAKASGKTISLRKWRLESFEMENRLAFRNDSDVLWPTKIPDVPAVQAYVEHLSKMGRPVALRNAAIRSKSKVFQDNSEKELLEQVFLVRGCQIKQECNNLRDNARPLGYHNLDCLGFGSMFVTYRNCPNNCPLALWVQQAEYPALFPRKTNTQTAGENFVKEILS